MKTSKFLLISTFFYFFPLIMTVLISSCHKSTCQDLPINRYYDVKSMESIVVNTNDNKPYVATQTFHYNKILIGIQVLAVEYVAINSESNSKESSNSLLMACNRLPEGYSGSKDWIKSIKITSNNAFSADFPAGADLANKFWLYGYDYFLLSDLISISKATPHTSFEYYTKPVSITPVDEINKMRTNSQTKAFRALGLNDVPTASKSHIFTIKYEHGDGETFTFTTPNINFL